MSAPIRVVSLFSGCGAADYALEQASIETGVQVEVVMAVDSWPVAARVRDANLGGVRTTIADVKQLTRADLPDHDLVIGGPPCQSHSGMGPKDCRCHVGGPVSPRCCLADFQRLASGSAWLMENVRSQLIPAPWSERLYASDFGDVTSRRRWWYSNYLLHVARRPGPLRLGDIRDLSAPRLPIALPSGPSRRGRKYGEYQRIAALQDDAGFIGCVTAASWHSNTATQLAAAGGGRNPTVLEMQRAHSIPDQWDWVGANMEQRGRLIANCWPIWMATSVLSSLLWAVDTERAAAA